MTTQARKSQFLNARICPPKAVGLTYALSIVNMIVTSGRLVSISGLVLATTLSLGLALAPLVQAPKGTTIVGKAVEADGQQPISDAIVSLEPLAGDTGAAVSTGQVGAKSLTTSNGQFLFRDVLPGKYTLTISSSGYLPGTYGQTRPSGPGVPLSVVRGATTITADIKAWRYGSIQGMVLDQYGDPAIGVPVRAFRRTFIGVQERFVSSSFVSTDDLGRYRFSDLIPGRYLVGINISQQTVPVSVVSASIRPSQGAQTSNSQLNGSLNASGAPNFASSAGFRVGDFILRQPSEGLAPPRSDGRIAAYRSVFFPNVLDATQSSQIDVNAGDSRSGINLRLQLSTTASVSGTITSPDGPVGFVGVRLLPEPDSPLQSEGLAEVASTATDASGKFTLLGVPPGSYALVVRRFPRSNDPTALSSERQTIWLSVPLAVGDKDISGISLSVQRGFGITGRVVSHSATQPSSTELQAFAVSLSPAGGHSSSILAPIDRVRADGTFETSGFSAGKYLVNVPRLPAGWSLESAMVGNQDATLRPIEIRDADISGVTVVVTNKPTQLSGFVSEVEGNAPEVVVFPADEVALKESGFEPRHTRNVKVGRDNSFTIAGLPPGEYYVAAVSLDNVGEWRDPVYLPQLVGIAQKVRMESGSSAQVNLKPGRIR